MSLSTYHTPHHCILSHSVSLHSIMSRVVASYYLPSRTSHVSPVEPALASLHHITLYTLHRIACHHIASNLYCITSHCITFASHYITLHRILIVLTHSVRPPHQLLLSTPTSTSHTRHLHRLRLSRTPLSKWHPHV